jgi:hypothetical protein
VQRVVLLVLFGLLLGAALTGIAGALPGSHEPDALTWLGSVSTVAALVVAVGIFRVQQTQSDAAHQELLDALKAQDEILQDLTDTTPASEPPESAPAPAPAKTDDPLINAQREAVEAEYGDRAIGADWEVRPGRGGDRARAVRLVDGTLLAVYRDGRGRMHVREVKSRRERGRPPRDRRPRGPEST